MFSPAFNARLERDEINFWGKVDMMKYWKDERSKNYESCCCAIFMTFSIFRKIFKEIIKARIWMEFNITELTNPLKSVRHCKLPKRQTSREYWHFILRSKNHLHLGSAEGLLESTPGGDRTHQPTVLSGHS